MKQCPFCKVDMIRPRPPIFGKQEYFIRITCYKFKEKKHTEEECEYCRNYNDWACPQCGVLLFYREEEEKNPLDKYDTSGLVVTG